MKKISKSILKALFICSVMLLDNCGGVWARQDAKNLANDVLTIAQIACVFASTLTDEKLVADACRIDKTLTPVLRELIGQREGSRKAGVTWHLKN